MLASGIFTSRTTIPRRTATCRPAPATARSPASWNARWTGGYDGFAVLEPHLVVAELSFGFTGPERFADAATALKNILDQRRIAYA